MEQSTKVDVKCIERMNVYKCECLSCISLVYLSRSRDILSMQNVLCCFPDEMRRTDFVYTLGGEEKFCPFGGSVHGHA